jgi:hypothetical protein
VLVHTLNFGTTRRNVGMLVCALNFGIAWKNVSVQVRALNFGAALKNVGVQVRAVCTHIIMVRVVCALLVEHRETLLVRAQCGYMLFYVEIHCNTLEEKISEPCDIGTTRTNPNIVLGKRYSHKKWSFNLSFEHTLLTKNIRMIFTLALLSGLCGSSFLLISQSN